jgi:hypothetical protein
LSAFFEIFSSSGIVNDLATDFEIGGVGEEPVS